MTSSQIEFKPLRGNRAFGYDANLLPAVCGVFMDADEAEALTARGNTRAPAREVKELTVACRLLRPSATAAGSCLMDGRANILTALHQPSELPVISHILTEFRTLFTEIR